ncbi:aminopeptidase [Halteromyces radiatus]|uniref:aminopeptidase n=1 Tax=Halteromyces radiatus TaxID=101107 RepID=UPI0022208D02|nr:aminopeptidase [Halteromyces radiatus]KAI8089940.1 aminopeptidase [Halteromyces radiatus]
MCTQHVDTSDRQILPTNVKPVHYDLSLQPNLETFVFKGQVKINLDVIEPTRVITLNSHEINIISATLIVNDFSQSSIDITYDTKKTEVKLTFPQEVSAHTKALLDINFEGILNDQMTGFYRSSYKDDQGNTKYLATTQFEPSDARRGFPCFDEPSLKATFDMTLVVPSHLTALSNTNVIFEINISDDLKQVKYATTPLMSTYLLAFVIGPFEYIEAFTSGEHNGQPIRSRVYTLPGLAEQGRHALNVCVSALEYFAKVFGEPYPLPKLDMVAVPDFEAGAMENWGLVTYRTVSLLFDEKQSSIVSKKRTAYVVCHELAHQWFGNLVTMKWWNELWLNESFATWVGWLAVDNIFPDWDVWTSFVNEDMPRALNLDALRSSHPIDVAVNDPAEIHQIFDAISYYKGASVIRMLSSWLGVETFLAGVRRYVRRHKLGNASTDDLWMALSEEAGVDVSQFMDLWTKRVGYPVLNVTKETGNSIKVVQSRYLSTGDLQAEEDVTVWWAPLGMLVPNQVASYTLTEKSQSFPIPDDGLFKLNAGQTSVYRVNYPIESIRVLAEEVKKGSSGLLTNTSDRVGLIADAGNLCVSGEQSTTAFLELAQAFVNEDNYFVWSQLSTHLSNILGVWYEQPEHIKDGLKALRKSLFAPVAHRLGWEFAETDDYLTNILRVLALTNAGRSNDTTTVTEAKKRFDKFVAGDMDALHPNLRGPVYGIVLSNAANVEEENAVWEKILQMYHNECLPTDQRLIALNSLGGAKSEALISRYLLMSLDEKEVRGQDSIYVFGSLAANPDARLLFWQFFTQNYDLLYSKFCKTISLFGAAVRSAVGGFSSLEKLEEIEAFFADKDTKEYARPLQQALEGARVNAKWLLRSKESVALWVQNNADQFK